jgi:hypothetical protein
MPLIAGRHTETIEQQHVNIYRFIIGLKNFHIILTFVFQRPHPPSTGTFLDKLRDMQQNAGTPVNGSVLSVLTFSVRSDMESVR